MRYLHLDVFTETPFEGNQLAVFPDPPPGTAVERMQRIAAEMAFSETTFVLPREGAGHVRMRIFTPTAELPMAGHPTIGTTFALAAAGVIDRGRPEFIFELGVGPTPVALEWSADRLAFAWMAQQLPEFGPRIEDRAACAAAFGLSQADMMDLPIEAVSCGVPFLFVPLASRGAVDRVGVETRALARLFGEAHIGELPIFFFTTDRVGATGDETAYSRMLAPAFGILEDPATGGASGPLGCYMLQYGLISAEDARGLISLQGMAMKRPSRIHIAVESNGGRITGVRVGGTAVLVAEGQLLV